MARKRDLTKHFEAILGREIHSGPGDVLILREIFGLTTLHFDGQTTFRDIGTTGASAKRCGTANIIDVGGIAVTGEDGKVEFPLSDFHCLTAITYNAPIIFVATPQSVAPVFVTSTRTIQTDGADVLFTVYSWNASGAPASRVVFNWRCQLPYENIVT